MDVEWLIQHVLFCEHSSICYDGADFDGMINLNVINKHFTMDVMHQFYPLTSCFQITYSEVSVHVTLFE